LIGVAAGEREPRDREYDGEPTHSVIKRTAPTSFIRFRNFDAMEDSRAVAGGITLASGADGM
jgi:hypothetical protein